MNVRPEFRNFIHYDGSYTRGSDQKAGPEELSGQFVDVPDIRSHTPEEVFKGVQGVDLLNTMHRSRRENPELAKTGEATFRMLEDSVHQLPGFSVGQAISSVVSSSLGGLPVSLGAASVYHPEEMSQGTMFSAKYYVGNDDRPNRDSADGTVYIDAGTGALYIHNQPTDPQWR